MAHIEFSHVNLEYPIRENQGLTFKEFIVRGLFRKKKTGVRSIKALSDLSFEIHDGERVGIIGLNGAGKSTLLRTIGGIYPIESGTRTIQGSICSLFDIALGFEPEATGWQNIYFRSYLQGETPRTVKGKLKEIADFTELGDYLNLPIRCYSSGMLMRLAFAIATSAQPGNPAHRRGVRHRRPALPKESRGAYAQFHASREDRRHGRPQSGLPGGVLHAHYLAASRRAPGRGAHPANHSSVHAGCAATPAGRVIVGLAKSSFAPRKNVLSRSERRRRQRRRQWARDGHRSRRGRG